MARIRPLRIDADSPFLGEPCALCQAEFTLGDKVIVCPEDAVRHHLACWEANGNHCVAFGCGGHGRPKIFARTPRNPEELEEDPIVLDRQVLEGELVDGREEFGRRYERSFVGRRIRCRTCGLILAALFLLGCVCLLFSSVALVELFQALFETPEPLSFPTPTPLSAAWKAAVG